MSQLPKEGIFIRRGKKVIVCNSYGGNTCRLYTFYNKSIYMIPDALFLINAL